MECPVKRTVRLVGLGSGRGVASKTRWRLGLARERRRLATPRARRPVAGRISSQPADGCPAPGGINSPLLNGARREKDLNTPAAGLDRGWRAASNPPGPVRAACGELHRIRSGSIPSWGPLGERIIPTVNPGNKDRAPKVSVAGNPGKAR